MIGKGEIHLFKHSAVRGNQSGLLSESKFCFVSKGPIQKLEMFLNKKYESLTVFDLFMKLQLEGVV